MRFGENVGHDWIRVFSKTKTQLAVKAQTLNPKQSKADLAHLGTTSLWHG